MPRPSLDARARAQTAGYFGGHVVLGLVSASLGPTLPALAAQISSVPEALGSLFTARGLGYLLGSLSCGRLYDRHAAHPLLALAIALMAAGMGAVPLMSGRVGLLLVMLVIGGAQGLLDVGNNTTLVRVHGPRVAPYMNALHCCYGIGAILSPLAIEAAPTLGWSYASLALASLPVALGLLAIRSPPSASEPSRAPSPNSAAAEPTPDLRPSLLLAFVILFVFCQGAESGFGAWLYVLAQNLGLSDAEATRLLSGFWAAFTGGRVLSIVIATRVRPQRMLGLDLIGAVLGVVLLLTIPSPLGLWIGALTLGLALASVFPTALALAGEHLTLSGAVTSRIFVGASLGTVTMPWLIGASFGLGLLAPLLLILANLLCASLVFVLILRSTRASHRAIDTHGNSHM